MSEIISIILPTYNERKNIGQLVPQILDVCRDNQIASSLIIVDDNSPDGTAAIVSQLAQKFPGQISLIKRSQKMGLGSAYLAGFKKALREQAHYIFEMDADLSHSPTDIPRLLAAAHSHDLVLGSRYVPGGKVNNWSALRKIISRGGTLYAKTILGLPINDLTSGFKCFSANVLKQLDLSKIKSDGYSFQVELTYHAYQAGFKIKEVPITFEDRQVGQSKFSKQIFWEAALMIWRLRLGTRL
ncbi:polyprenol monophosphomannose synthase [Patescibacteria group bacterium]|nr:polyprenol monophosphomannose synthase [Patescibacteria group bacterium]